MWLQAHTYKKEGNFITEETQNMKKEINWIYEQNELEESSETSAF